mgnify:CR=1 FL=1
MLSRWIYDLSAFSSRPQVLRRGLIRSGALYAPEKVMERLLRNSTASFIHCKRGRSEPLVHNPLDSERYVTRKCDWLMLLPVLGRWISVKHDPHTLWIIVEDTALVKSGKASSQVESSGVQ